MEAGEEDTLEVVRHWSETLAVSGSLKTYRNAEQPHTQIEASEGYLI